MTLSAPLANLEPVIEAAWDARDAVTLTTKGEVRDAVEAVLEALDKGQLRVAEKRGPNPGGSDWHVNQWAKKAVLLSFRLNDMAVIPGGNGAATWWDKVPSKFDGWGKASGVPQASAPCPARSCGGPPSSARTWC